MTIGTLLVALFAAVSLATFHLLLQGLRWTMATLRELKDAIASVQTGVDGLEQAITDLKAQVADGLRNPGA